MSSPSKQHRFALLLKGHVQPFKTAQVCIAAQDALYEIQYPKADESACSTCPMPLSHWNESIKTSDSAPISKVEGQKASSMAMSSPYKTAQVCKTAESPTFLFLSSHLMSFLRILPLG
jgi:hypothetical protein